MAETPDDFTASEQAEGGEPSQRPRSDVPSPKQPTDDEAALTWVTRASETAVAKALDSVLDVEGSLAALKQRLPERSKSQVDADDSIPRARPDGGRNWPMNVVQALLASPKLADGLTRALLFELVDAELTRSVEMEDQPTLMREFLALVRHCDEQQGGLTALEHAVVQIEGSSWTSHVVGELVRQRLAKTASVNDRSPDRHQPGERWDFFVSYTSTNREWAAWISWQLEKAGYGVLVQEWDFVPGSNWHSGMDKGVTQCERTIAVLSPAYLSSVYGWLEWQAVQDGDPAGLTRRLVPVMVERCSPSGLLSSLVYIDLTPPELTDTDARDRLLAGIGGARTGRSKPAVAPRFPPTGEPR